MRKITLISLLLFLVSACIGSDRRRAPSETMPEEPEEPEITLMEDPPDEETPPGEEEMPPPGVDEVDPEDPCMGIDFLGMCDGATAVWCQDGALQRFDCASEGLGCGWVDEDTGYYCMEDPSTEPPPPTGDCGSPIEQAQLAETNAARAAAGLGALVCDPDLTIAARLHSQDMCELGYFDHDSADGRTFADRIREQGVSYRTAGENIAHGQTTASEVHIDWMNSPGHRANILNGAFGRIGIGYVECGGRPYWTQDFTD